MSDKKWEIVAVFESSMEIDSTLPLTQNFDVSFLNHIIQYEDVSDDPDMPGRRINYRVTIEAYDAHQGGE